MNEMFKSVKTHQERRRRIRKNPPAQLKLGAIITTRREAKENAGSLSKYPTVYDENSFMSEAIKHWLRDEYALAMQKK